MSKTFTFRTTDYNYEEFNKFVERMELFIEVLKARTEEAETLPSNKGEILSLTLKKGIDTVVEEIKNHPTLGFDLFDDIQFNQHISDLRREDQVKLPSQETIKVNLIKYLQQKENKSATRQEVISYLEKHLNLSNEQLNAKLKDGRSLFANRVEYAVLEMREELMLEPASKGRGRWTLVE